MSTATFAPSINLLSIYVGVFFLPCFNHYRLYRFAMGLAFLFFGGFVSLVLGVIIWTQFPLSGSWTVVIFWASSCS